MTPRVHGTGGRISWIFMHFTTKDETVTVLTQRFNFVENNFCTNRSSTVGCGHQNPQCSAKKAPLYFISPITVLRSRRWREYVTCPSVAGFKGQIENRAPEERRTYCVQSQVKLTRIKYTRTNKNQ